MVYSKTPLASRSLTEQFTKREVRKKYLLLTDRPVAAKEVTARSSLQRAGEKYLSRPAHTGAQIAETRFGVPALAGPDTTRQTSLHLIEANP